MVLRAEVGQECDDGARHRRLGFSALGRRRGRQAAAGLRKSTSRKLFLRRTFSVIRSGSSSRWMSRLSKRALLGARGRARPVPKVRPVDDHVLGAGGSRDRPGISCAEKGQQQPLGSEHALQLAREAFRGHSVQKVEDVPAENPADRLSLVWKARVEEGAELIELALDDMPIDVLGEILEADLQLISSRKKVTLEPTTGPRSSSTGCARPLSPARNFSSTLVGYGPSVVS